MVRLRVINVLRREMCRRQKEWLERSPIKAISNKEVVASAGSGATLEVAASAERTSQFPWRCPTMSVGCKPRVPLYAVQASSGQHHIGDIKVWSEEKPGSGVYPLMYL